MISIGYVLSSVIAILTLGIIISEKYHRTPVAFMGAMVMMVAGSVGHFYSFDVALASIDLKTLALLFGSMILVVILEETGFFQYVGIYTAKATRGNPWSLLVGLGALTGILSMFLNNVTTVMLIAPIAITVARILELSPIPYLMSAAIMANVGGVGTLVGHPPNVLIGYAAGIGFNNFFMHAFPVALISGVFTLFSMKLIYRTELRKRPEHIEALMLMDPHDAIVNKKIARTGVLVLITVIMLFFLQDVSGLDAAVVSLCGAAILLILVDPKRDPQHILARTEVSLLLFFTSLFVIFGALRATGVLDSVAHLLLNHAEANLLLTAVIILWVSAVLSALIDNIPLAVAMIPIIQNLDHSGVPVMILWWALIFGVGFGGHGSPIGSAANLVAIAHSEQTDTPITLRVWLRSGLSSMLICLLVATLGLVIYGVYGLA
jgi:Na+/H+ antiporter NhaD/arsenite permease-like protein